MDGQMNDQPKAPERRSVGGGDGKNGPVLEDAMITLREGAGDSATRRAVVAFSYEQVHPDELCLQVGDIIEVLGEEEEGWLRGRLNGNVGVFPKAFVKMQESSESSCNGEPEMERSAIEKETTGSGDDQPIFTGDLVQTTAIIELSINNATINANDKVLPSYNLTAWSAPSHVAEENVASKNDGESGAESLKEVSPDEKLSSESSIHTGITPPIPPPDNENRSVLARKNDLESSLKQVFASKLTANEFHSNTSSAKPKEYAKVIQAHQAETDGQLSLQVGSVVTVLAKEVEGDQDEWLGELNNKRGTFPSSCVTTISAEEAEKPLLKPSAAVGAPPPLPFKPPKLKPVLPPPPESPIRTTTAEIKLDSMPLAKVLPPIPKPMETKEEKPTKVSPSSSAIGIKPDKSTNRLTSLGKWFKTSREKSPSSAKNGTPLEIKTDDFGGTGSDSESLSHLTVQRPRNPGKRPPSQAFLKEMAMVHPIPVATSNMKSSPILPPKALPVPNVPKKPQRSRSPTSESKDEGITISDGSKGEYVRREEFDQLVANFEAFRRETANQIRELEKRLAASEKLQNV